MSRIVVTGASGFVGKNLIRFVDSPRVDIQYLSLRCEKKAYMVQSADVIVHLAGKAHDLKNASQPNEYYEVNYELTKKLYDAFLRSDAKKFIFISSVKAVADSVAGILTEQAPPDPKTHYGRSKLMAEEYIQSRALPRGKTYYILRPCMIHGPGNKGNLNLLYKFVSKGLPYPLSAFDNKRSFLSVENLCFIIKEILQRDNIPSGVYHVADDDALSTREVVSLLSQSMGKNARLWNIPKTIIELFARVGDILRLPLNSERLGKLTENYVVSNEKIKQVLATELPLTAREGLMKTAESFRNSKR